MRSGWSSFSPVTKGMIFLLGAIVFGPLIAEVFVSVIVPGDEGLLDALSDLRTEELQTEAYEYCATIVFSGLPQREGAINFKPDSFTALELQDDVFRIESHVLVGLERINWVCEAKFFPNSQLSRWTMLDLKMVPE